MVKTRLSLANTQLLSFSLRVESNSCDGKATTSRLVSSATISPYFVREVAMWSWPYGWPNRSKKGRLGFFCPCYSVCPPPFSHPNPIVAQRGRLNASSGLRWCNWSGRREPLVEGMLAVEMRNNNSFYVLSRVNHLCREVAAKSVSQLLCPWIRSID